MDQGLTTEIESGSVYGNFWTTFLKGKQRPITHCRAKYFVLTRWQHYSRRRFDVSDRLYTVWVQLRVGSRTTDLLMTDDFLHN